MKERGAMAESRIGIYIRLPLNLLATHHQSASLNFGWGFRNGSMIPKIYWYAWDKYLSNGDSVLFTSSDRTYLNLSASSSNYSRGCLAQTRLEGRSYPGDGTYYSFTISASGFISRGNSSLNGDADYFTLNNALVTYGGTSKWGKIIYSNQVKISNNLKPLFFITFVLSCFFFFNHQEKPSLEKAQIKTTTKNDNKELIKSINMLREDIFNLKEELEILKEDHKSFILNKNMKRM